MSSEQVGNEQGSRVIVVRRRLRDAMVTGIALTIPLFVTLVVLGVVVNFVGNTVQPAVDVARSMLGLGPETPTVALQAVTVAGIALLILLVGLVAEFRSSGRIEQVFDDTMAKIPGLGSVYTSFNQMSEMLLRNDTQSFREVYLVEYPAEGSYTLAFLTANTPEFVAEAAGEDDLVTLFMPMAPNPVMGGFVIHVSGDRIYEVDMTVEEGISSIVTSGVAFGDAADSRIPADHVEVPAEEAPVSKEFTPQAPTAVARDGDGESGESTGRTDTGRDNA